MVTLSLSSGVISTKMLQEIQTMLSSPDALVTVYSGSDEKILAYPSLSQLLRLTLMDPGSRVTVSTPSRAF